MSFYKYCTKCKKVKFFTEFHKDKQKKNGYRFWCKECAYEVVKRKVKRDQIMIKKYKELVCIH